MTKLDCGHETPEHGSIDTGYGIDSRTGETRCYDCCAAVERQSMIDTGKATLYLVEGSDLGLGEVTDWPGKLRFHVRHIRHGHHNIAGNREDVWFIGPDNQQWHGVHYGKWNDLVHCRRAKTH